MSSGANRWGDAIPAVRAAAEVLQRDETWFHAAQAATRFDGDFRYCAEHDERAAAYLSLRAVATDEAVFERAVNAAKAACTVDVYVMVRAALDSLVGEDQRGVAVGVNEHLCHATGCETPVPPRMLMCRYHWRLVPRRLRDQVWDAYVPGQERRKDATPEYIDAAHAAIEAVAAKAGGTHV